MYVLFSCHTCPLYSDPLKRYYKPWTENSSIICAIWPIWFIVHYLMYDTLHSSSFIIYLNSINICLYNYPSIFLKVSPDDTLTSNICLYNYPSIFLKVSPDDTLTSCMLITLYSLLNLLYRNNQDMLLS